MILRDAMGRKGCSFLFVVLVKIIAEGECKALLQPEQYQVYKSFNDPEFPNQFYLADDLMNIREAWNEGINGSGITICINDPTGVDHSHPDLSRRFRLDGSFNFVTNSSDPKADDSIYPDGEKAHGTMVAGLVAAEANNGNCAVGVAYEANISGLKIDFEKSKWNFYEGVATSLKYRNDINDIYTNAWGFVLPAQTNVAYIYESIKEALRDTAEKGRNGKGGIVVFASGNGGMYNGTCGYDEIISSIYTIGISVMTGRSTMAFFNVKCTGVMAVTYARDGADGIDNPEFQMPAPGLNKQCTKTAAASSASAAVASGMLALVLQANPNLTWRDVQHLIVRSSSSNFNSVTWKINGAGLKVHDGFGFGVMDAKALTDNAKIWKNVDRQLNCTLSYIENTDIDGVATLNRFINISKSLQCREIKYLEHVVLVLKLNFTFRRNIEVTLTSPIGTRSIMLRSGRNRDMGKEINDLSLLSLHHWGESPNEIWKLAVRNVKPDAKLKGYLFSFSLQLFGTSTDPMLSNKGTRSSQIGINSTTSTTTTAPPSTKQSTNSSTQRRTSSSDPTVSTSTATQKKTDTKTMNNISSTERPTSSSDPTVSTSAVSTLVTKVTETRKNNQTIVAVAVSIPVAILVIVLLIFLLFKFKKRPQTTQQGSNDIVLT